MADQATQAFGENGSDITEEELAAMKRSGNRIGKGVGRPIAQRYPTATTLKMLAHCEEQLPLWGATVTWEEVQEDIAWVAAGNPSRLFVHAHQQGQRPAEDSQLGAEQSSGGMVPNSSADKVEQITRLAKTSPALAAEILTLMQSALGAMSRGATESTIRDVFDFVNIVASGQDPDLRLEDNTAGGTRAGKTLRVVNASRAAKIQAEQELAKAKDDSDPTSLAGELKKAKADLAAAQAAATAATDGSMVKKVDLKSDVETLVTAVNNGRGIRGIKVDDIKPTVNKLANLTGATPAP
jgi:hypothetical protein